MPMAMSLPHSHHRLPQNDWMEEYCHRGISPNSNLVESIGPQKYSPSTFCLIFIWATMKRQRIEKHWKSWFNQKWKLFSIQLFSDVEFVTLWMWHRICQIILRKVNKKKWKMAANKLFICEFQWMIIVPTIWHNSFHVILINFNLIFRCFLEAISFIEKARNERAAVLVHCWAGIRWIINIHFILHFPFFSRSVTVCLAYLMYSLRCPLDEAFDRLLKQNGTIAPNFHFMEVQKQIILPANFNQFFAGFNPLGARIVRRQFFLLGHGHPFIPKSTKTSSFGGQCQIITKCHSPFATFSIRIQSNWSWGPSRSCSLRHHRRNAQVQKVPRKFEFYANTFFSPFFQSFLFSSIFLLFTF